MVFQTPPLPGTTTLFLGEAFSISMSHHPVQCHLSQTKELHWDDKQKASIPQSTHQRRPRSPPT